MKSVLLTGATGTLGTVLVDLLSQIDHDLYLLTSGNKIKSRKNLKIVKGDLGSPSIFQNEIPECSIIIHCASNFNKSELIDVEGTKKLLEICEKWNPENFIYISIIGVDKSSLPYYISKAKAENMIAKSGIPYSILRSTQFHNLILNMIESFQVQDQRILTPRGLEFQSIDIHDVANKLLELVRNPPINSVIEMGGPEIMMLEEMISQYLTIRGKNLKIELVSLENKLFDVFSSGINISQSQITGTISWQDFLRSEYES